MMVEEEFTENLSNFSSIEKEGGGCFSGISSRGSSILSAVPARANNTKIPFFPPIFPNRFVFPRAPHTRLFRSSDSPRRNDRCIHLSLSLISSRRDKSYPPAHERTIDDERTRRNRRARCSIRRANGKNREREREIGG